MLRTVFVTVFCVFTLGREINAQLEAGDRCSMKNGASGVCKLPEDCPVVYEALKNGKTPETLCGFSGFEPIICCPDGRVTGTTPTSTTTTTTEAPTTMRRLNSNPSPTPEVPMQTRSRGDIAKQKCSEYAKSVFEFVYPPILTTIRKPVNMSTCAVLAQQLIVGGSKAGSKEFPHMTAVGFESEGGIIWGCGGTLVSENFVLTAAHCTYSGGKRAAWVRVGDLNLVDSTDDALPQNRAVIERIRHPRYKYPSTYHDIALLKTNNPIEFNAYARPACLPTSRVPASTRAIATGWGRVDWTNENGSNDLLKVVLPTVNVSQCNSSFGSTDDYRLERGIVDDYQMCAGEFGKDTCQGDSGGPLVVFSKNEYCMYEVVGVTSLGRLCGSILPGIYTRVYTYIPWIERVVWSNA